MVEAVMLACAVLAVGASLVVVMSRDVLHAAIALLVVMLALAGIYAGAGAMLIAAVQVLVGAGAVVVLFMFAMMVLDARREGPSAFRMGRMFRPATAAASLVIFAVAFAAAGFIEISPASMPGLGAVVGHLFSGYVLVVEATGLLLFVTLVAVVVLARRVEDPPMRSARRVEDPPMRSARRDEGGR